MIACCSPQGSNGKQHLSSLLTLSPSSKEHTLSLSPTHSHTHTFLPFPFIRQRNSSFFRPPSSPSALTNLGARSLGSSTPGHSPFNQKAFTHQSHSVFCFEMVNDPLLGELYLFHTLPGSGTSISITVTAYHAHPSIYLPTYKHRHAYMPTQWGD